MQILYCFIMEPSSLPPTYVKFITRQGGKDPAVWAGIRVRHAAMHACTHARAAAGTPGSSAAVPRPVLC